MSARSERSARSSIETDDSRSHHNQHDVVELASITSSAQSSAYRVRSLGSSLSNPVSRVLSLKKTVSESVKRATDRIRDDNAEYAKEELAKKSTRLGREMTNLGLEDAIRIATYKSENEGRDRNNEKEDLERVTTDETSEKIPPPDTGYAWVIALCGFLSLFATWGANGAYGVYLSYWLNNETFPGGTAKDYALVGSIVLCLTQSLAPLVQMLFAIVGLKPVVITGIILQLAGNIAGSFSNTLGELYVTQAFLLGTGFALAFNPPNTLVSEWFDKRRGISSGISICASGVGGVVFSLSSQALIERTGSFRWSLRIIGIVCLVVEIVIVALVKPRLPRPKLRTLNDIRTRAHVIFDIRVVKKWYVHSISIWFLLVQGCYIIVLFSLSAYCTFIGFSQSVGSTMTAIFNACQAIGRFSIGLSSDYTGRTNIALVLNVVMVILIFAMWINSFSYITVLFYAILSGLTFGVSAVMNQPIMADQVGAELFPSAWSFENFFMGAWSLVVEVVALKLRNQGAKRPFLRAQILAGCFAAGGLLFMFPIRELKIRLFMERRLQETEKALEKTNLDTSETQLLVTRKDHYAALLQSGPLAYLRRMTYPLKV